MPDKSILLVGTLDTKADEIHYLGECIRSQGGEVVAMDVGVLGDPERTPDISKSEVAAAAGKTIEFAQACGDENTAMQIMAGGAANLATDLYKAGRVHGVLAIGGTMGTDLALDVCHALPIGFPKLIVSTVAFSPLIPADRLAPDIQMILWAGGLYGLNSICRSSLSQAAGAILGSARAAKPPSAELPLVGMTGLGKSCLSYMVDLKPEIEKRGFEVAVFHATGMGGMAFEGLARQKEFACVMDFALPEGRKSLRELNGQRRTGPATCSGAGRNSTDNRPGMH